IEHIPSHLYLMCVYHHHYFFFIDQATTEIYTLSLHDALPIWVRQEDAGARVLEHELELPRLQFGVERHRDRAELGAGKDGHAERDRKSTRLNSSHVAISYAVFCLKKKIFAGEKTFVVTHKIRF